jgi:hypothetical protein
LPLDRLARAIPLIEDSPQISWLRLNSPVLDRTALSPMHAQAHPCGLPLQPHRAIENDSNRRLNTRARATNITPNRYVRQHRTFTSYNKTNYFVSP